MNTLWLPWIEIGIALPLIAAVRIRWLDDPVQMRQVSLLATGATLLCTLTAWFNLILLDGANAATGSWGEWSGTGLTIDGLNAPLLPLVSLLYLLTVLATLGAKIQRFSFSSVLISEAILLGTLSCTRSWMVIALLAVGCIPPFLELHNNRRSKRVFTLHMLLFVGLLFAGQALISIDARGVSTILGVTLLAAAIFVRNGILPLHSWMAELFEHASFGTALLFVCPMVGNFAAMRLVFPLAPVWLLNGIAVLSLFTAIYAAGMALVQHEARRFFSYLFLSHSSLVLVGLQMATPLGVTAVLCMWLSVSLSMAGFGLTLRAIEARTGRLTLDQFHGLAPHTPRLAALFLITGLASIGFPGTIGFVGTDLLVDGTVTGHPLVGVAVVITATLNGLAVLHIYFRVFTGTRHVASIDLNSRLSERIAVLILTALILGGGLFPQPGVSSRFFVASQLIEQRLQRLKAPSKGTIAEHDGRVDGTLKQALNTRETVSLPATRIAEWTDSVE